MHLLVAGASEVDAGKTTFTTGLVERTRVRAYKPRAGNDYWYDHDDYRDAVQRSRLYGKDARRLAAAAPGDVRPEAINPIHRLWLPTPGTGKGLLGRADRAFVVDRVTHPDACDDGSDAASEPDACDDGSDAASEPDAAYIVNGTVTVPPAAERAFPLDAAPTVESLPALNEAMAEIHGPALAAIGEEIDARDDAIVESYSDIARPLADFVPDAVAVVEPRRCRVYHGDRYAKACEVASGSAHEGRLEERVEHVVSLLDPVASITLPALSNEERADLPVVVDAYAEAYDALLDVARKRQ